MEAPSEDPRSSMEAREAGAGPLAPESSAAARPLAGRARSFNASAVSTVLGQTLVLIAVEILLIGALAQVGISAGNAGGEEIQRLADEGGLRLLFLGALVAPLLEELVFRWIPSRASDWILRRRSGMRWGLGLAATLLFAAFHNVTSKAAGAALPLGEGRYFDLEVLPLPQLLVGLYCWHLVRTRGLWANLLAHSFHNGLLLSIGLVFAGSPS